MDNMVEAVGRALAQATVERLATREPITPRGLCELQARAAIAAARPFILEQAAKVADDFDDPDPNCISDRIAQAIRALGEQSNAG